DRQRACAQPTDGHQQRGDEAEPPRASDRIGRGDRADGRWRSVQLRCHHAGSVASGADSAARSRHRPFLVIALTLGTPDFARRRQISNTGVVKSELGTREAVARLLMEQGPIPATAVASALSLSGPAVRRHLDALIADGEAELRAASRRARRGRGRPAGLYLLTDAGRARFGHGYDDLAVAALRYLAEHVGPSAVQDFAAHRVDELLGEGKA